MRLRYLVGFISLLYSLNSAAQVDFYPKQDYHRFEFNWCAHSDIYYLSFANRTYELEAEIFEREGNLEAATNSRLKAFSIDPYDIPNIISLRKLYVSLNNTEELIKIQSYLKELDLNPDLINY